ncbi:MAG: leucyl/phenylalanyl-tRNA--protein transferase [Deltaproteobacteria bacterium]|nr:leucyl/phenylalanyl-tRNA--protein transferase [Deltaproteobacteria bacterium]
MPIYRLTKELVFPPPTEAVNGLLAVGGDLRPERLLLAYSQGIFPWYDEDQPILWHSPDPRAVLAVDKLHVGRTLKKVMNKKVYELCFDTRFAEVIAGCKAAYRPGQSGTWITDEMEAAYVQLHRQGYAHSVETYLGGELVGGLYGVSLGRMFFGESMFSRASDASKIATVGLVEKVRGFGFRYIDCQVLNPHTEALGAEEWPRARYLKVLAEELAAAPTRRGSWT